MKASAARLVVILAEALLSACASSGPRPDSKAEALPAARNSTPSPASEMNSPDKGIARMLAGDNVGLAKSTADSLAASKDPVAREIGMYWKAVCFLYRDRPDLAMAILEPMRGKWTGGLRAIHSEVFLRLAREASEARVVSRARREETARLSQENEALTREFSSLKAEIARLETEKRKYEKLIKDLETIR